MEHQQILQVRLKILIQKVKLSLHIKCNISVLFCFNLDYYNLQSKERGFRIQKCQPSEKHVPLCSQYLVAAPFAQITASMWRDVEQVRLKHKSVQLDPLPLFSGLCRLRTRPASGVGLSAVTQRPRNSTTTFWIRWTSSTMMSLRTCGGCSLHRCRRER